MAPFFHQVAVQHGISTSTYGLIFSIHPFVVFCTSPFIGQMIPTIGPKVVKSIQMQTRKLKFVSILKVYFKIYTFYLQCLFKFMFIGGVFLSACCNILFGTLEFVNDDDQFVILCFLVRGIFSYYYFILKLLSLWWNNSQRIGRCWSFSFLYCWCYVCCQFISWQSQCSDGMTHALI